MTIGELKQGLQQLACPKCRTGDDFELVGAGNVDGLMNDVTFDVIKCMWCGFEGTDEFKNGSTGGGVPGKQRLHLIIDLV